MLMSRSLKNREGSSLRGNILLTKSKRPILGQRVNNVVIPRVEKRGAQGHVAIVVSSQTKVLNRDPELQSDSQMYECYICEKYTRYQLKCKVCDGYLVGISTCQECFDELHGDCKREQNDEFACVNCDIRSADALK